MAVFAFISAALILLQASARADTMPQLRLDGRTDDRSAADATRGFVFGSQPVTANLAGGNTGFSLSMPSSTQYLRFDEMNKGDRHLALAQVALEAVGKVLERPLGRALLALREPLRDIGGHGTSCKQRFSMKSYFLQCGLKF